MDTIQMKIAKTAAQNWGQQEPTTLEEALGITWDSEVAAVEGIGKALNLDESVVEKLVGTKDESGKLNRDGEIYTKAAISPEIAEQISASIRGPEDILSILSTIHDAWAKNNPNNFLKPDRNKERQFVDLRLLNWGEVESDLIFLQPILEAAGVTLDMEALREAHEMQQIQYLLDNKIFSHEDLVAHISQGSKVYSALEGLETKHGGNIDELLQNPEIAEKMAGQIESKVAIRSKDDFKEYIRQSENRNLTTVRYAAIGGDSVQINVGEELIADKIEERPYYYTQSVPQGIDMDGIISRQKSDDDGRCSQGNTFRDKLKKMQEYGKENKKQAEQETSRRGTISLKGIMQAIMGKFRVGRNDMEAARSTIDELARGQKGDETKSVSDNRREGVEVSD